MVIMLVGVAIIIFYAYERVARDVVKQRDTELARISAARLSDTLSWFSRVPQSIAAEDDVRSMEPARVSSALEKAQNQLSVFDAGVMVYNSEGVALWSQPVAAERWGTDFPITSEFDKVRRMLRPVFSNVFQDPVSGEDVILVGVPIVARDNEFKGVLAGMCTIKYSLLGAKYAEVLEIKAGRSSYAYLVDGNGRVIYHRYSSQVGSSLANTVPVMQVTKKKTGAILVEDATGETVISGFAPVPGTDWGLITQERWKNIVGPIRGYSDLLLGLLVLGGVVSSALIFFGLGRILKPIKYLTLGVQRIAGGDFDYNIVSKTGDEVEALARQFNIMAGALKKSYADLEQRVVERKQAERDLEDLNKQLQATVEKLTRANRELRRFAHIAAHDLKAPLRAIGTLADWISTDYTDKFDEEGKREVELLVGRVARMSDMIDSILRYSEAGRVVKEKEKVNLNALIEEVMAVIAPPENISITVENELPVVEGEKTHFIQVFQNLLSNAVKYMDKPKCQIKVGCIEQNGFWKFSVADNGPGVEKKYFEKIFEMFQTLLPRDEFEATGVGLSIVKKIVETYGGSVWVESEFGKGSVFFFTLPNQEMKVADDAKLKANIVG